MYENMKPTVLLYGDLHSVSGYGVHTRQIFDILLELDIDLHCEHVSLSSSTWILSGDKIDKINECCNKQLSSGIPDISIQVLLPSDWSTTKASKNIGVTALVETDICNPSWLENMMEMDMVVVPSEFNKLTIERTYYKHKQRYDFSLDDLRKKIIIIGESFTFSEENLTIPDLSHLKTNFNFFTSGQITGQNEEEDRKGLFSLIEAFILAFDKKKYKDNNAGLIIKTNMTRQSYIDRCDCLSFLRSAKYAVMNKHGVNPDDSPPIHLLHGYMDDREISGLYMHPSIKCFVTATKGESWCLPMMDAAVAGLPVIAVEWSGYLDFTRHSKLLKVEHSLVPVCKSKIDGKIFVNDSKWALVNRESLMATMRKLYEKPHIPRENAKKGSDNIKQEFSIVRLRELWKTRVFDTLLKS